MKLATKLLNMVAEYEVGEGLLKRLSLQLFNKCATSAEYEAKRGNRELKILIGFEGSRGGNEQHVNEVIKLTKALLESEGLSVSHVNENYEDYFRISW